MGVLPDPLWAAGRGPSLSCAPGPPWRRYTAASGRAVARPARARSRPARPLAADRAALARRSDPALAESAPCNERPRGLGRHPRTRQAARTRGGKSRPRIPRRDGEIGLAGLRSGSRHDRAAFGVAGGRFCNAANAQDSFRGAQDRRPFGGFSACVKKSLPLRRIFGRACACRIPNSGVGFLA